MRPESSPLLPGFPIRFGRPRVRRIELIKREVAEMSLRRLDELASLFSPWIDSSLLATTGSGKNSRWRTFSMEWVFWAFLCQLLGGLGCRGAVKRVQSWAVARGRKAPSSNPSAYCQARNRLPLAVLQKVFDTTARRLTDRVGAGELWHGHRVKVVDGTGLSAADTKPNQKEWPQSRNMKPGCGFPQLNLVGLFCLHTGALLGWREGNKHDHETSLWRKLWELLSPGDVVLGDRAFGSYADIARLKARGIDGVYRLHATRKLDWRRGKHLGRRDRLQVWNKPVRRPKGCPVEAWRKLPSQLQVRVVEKTVGVPGFRPEKIVLATTLADADCYPADELARLYRRRWSVEVFFRDVKITLGMDELKCQTPEAVRRELAMYLICHNLLRGMIQEAARRHDLPVEHISFQGAAEQLSHWLWLFMGTQTRAERQRRLGEFYLALVSAPLPQRPNRTEPRVRKRRPKNYRLMTRPRDADKPGKAA